MFEHFFEENRLSQAFSAQLAKHLMVFSNWTVIMCFFPLKITYILNSEKKLKSKNKEIHLTQMAIASELIQFHFNSYVYRLIHLNCINCHFLHVDKIFLILVWLIASWPPLLFVGYINLDCLAFVKNHKSPANLLEPWCVHSYKCTVHSQCNWGKEQKR